MQGSSHEISNYKTRRVFTVLLWGSVVVYLFVLANLLLFKYIPPTELFSPDRYVFRSVNFVPFAGIHGYLFGGAVSPNIAVGNVLGNIVLFMPLGLLLRLTRPGQKIRWTVLIVCLASIAVEVAQYALGVGAADIDDVILNTLGGLLGALVFSLLARWLKDPGKLHAFIAVVSVACAVLVMATQGRAWIGSYYPCTQQ